MLDRVTNTSLLHNSATKLFLKLYMSLHSGKKIQSFWRNACRYHDDWSGIFKFLPVELRPEAHVE